MDWKLWAQRRASRGPSSEPAPAQAPQARAAISSPPGPPPSGYAWAEHPTAGWVLVQIGAEAPSVQAPVSIPAPASRVPGTVLYAQSLPKPAPMAAPVETCTLVRKGDRDTYAELLATLPDLVPPSGFNAMKGTTNPVVQQELSHLPEFHDVGFAANPDAPAIAFPRGNDFGKIKPLSAASLPPPPDGLEEKN